VPAEEAPDESDIAPPSSPDKDEPLTKSPKPTVMERLKRGRYRQMLELGTQHRNRKQPLFLDKSSTLLLDKTLPNSTE
jgi:hypothetical protein